MRIERASDPSAWDAFIMKGSWCPFLQSWTMGEVYGDTGQRPVRLEVRDDSGIRAACFGHVVPARRGKHLSVPYGPVMDASLSAERQKEVTALLFSALKEAAKKEGCAFIRMSPFLTEEEMSPFRAGIAASGLRAISSPLHLLAEHVWYIDLLENGEKRSEESLRAAMRKTTRNLIGRAERDGVTIERASSPEEGLTHFIRLHDETRKRHGFTPYTNAFFRSQVERFSKRNECTVYLARYQGDVIAASVHMHAFGETSYHHGASSGAHHKVPASYLLQWTAITDALKRGDRIYNFWGIAPLGPDGNPAAALKTHPFGGVTLFKTGFGGTVRNLAHCIDIPLSPTYWLTYGFERMRKWRRGF